MIELISAGSQGKKRKRIPSLPNQERVSTNNKRINKREKWPLKQDIQAN